MTFVIVGGGPTGIEFAGALAELMRLVLAREYPLIEVEPRIVLVEGRDQLLVAFSKKLGDYAKQRLDHLGVEVICGDLVSSVEGDDVLLKSDETITCKTLVWSAGVKSESLAELEDVPRTDRKRIEVDGNMRIDGRVGAFAIGDIAGADPMLSAPAMQQGRYVGEFIQAHLADEPGDPVKMPPFAYVDKGTMATIGRNHAVCAMGKVELTGFIAWLAWLLVHVYYLIGFRNRLVALWSWAWNYIWYDRPVRIIARAKREPLSPSGGSSPPRRQLPRGEM